MPHRQKLLSDAPLYRWARAASIFVAMAALALFAVTFRSRLPTHLSLSILLELVLAALILAIALHIRFLLLARRAQHETVRALDATELEYKSVFDNALDAIVVFDNHGKCLQANPAARTLLGKDLGLLSSKPMEELLTDTQSSHAVLKDFIDGKHAHGETQIHRPDGATIFIEYTAQANYLLGRHVAVLRDVSERKRAEASLRDSEERFQQMANNIQEIFWLLDAESKEVIYVNKAYETITGRTCQSLAENPKSYAELVHPEDRIRVLSRLGESLQTGQFDEEFRIVRQDGAIRWVWIRGFPIRDSAGVVRRLVGSAQDVTSRKSAEEQIARNLDRAESAWAEAEAFRKTSLALTQNLSMDYVLDTLLESLLKLVPYESAQVLLLEADTHLFLARELQNCEPGRLPFSRVTLNARDSRYLMEILATRKSLLLTDTAQEKGWVDFKGFSHLRSWLCVPLVTAQQVVGFLSLGDTHVHAFTREHLRLAESLAIPAAVAIQNARLYEQTEIFRTELEQRLVDLQQTDRAQERTHRADQIT